jgi:hypothetical protein
LRAALANIPNDVNTLLVMSSGALTGLSTEQIANLWMPKS